MNSKAKNLIKNINYTVTANFFVLGISVLLNLFVPKFIGIKEYSYWQIYVFYSSYVGFFHFGWLDGIYLKIGGEEYSDLDHDNLGSQFWYLFIFENILSIAMIILIFLISNSPTKIIILSLTALVSVIRNCNTFILYVFQSTNRIKEYAQISRNDRYFYVLFLSIYIILGGNDYIVMIVLDIISRMLVTVWGGIKLRDTLFHKPMNIQIISREILDNIKIGSNLMISNIAGMFIIGISRVLVEFKWNIEVFGKLSLTLSISNMFMTFINAVGIVMFPLLRRTDTSKLTELYENLRNIFVPVSYCALIFFLPIKRILGIWLPLYKDSLVFMGILFPMIIYEGRMSLLVSTYLKTIRKEKIILLANLISLFFSLILSIITTILLNNLLLTVGIIVASLALRCIVGELLLVRLLNLKLKKKLIFETLLTLAFIFGNVFLRDLIGFLLYVLIFIIYAVYNFSSFECSLKRIITVFKS
ncbi:hypothetical protein ACO0KD_00060 [Enterococcus avium]|uniref:hypothetical protein n=1 Tax=Enterococcus avium TaxID=33945 RepID=UPI00136C7108|nr:hypothetical protein [Enterococcus avium]MDT2433692.1 hypothetical protein [Enterococcus avium]MDT2447174.1 hypothetical protein [Enterococcus avium]MDT2464035.1 hypothetical protein [Enterococcus avium]MDT2503454.1 hypothetical protein [Enterococcus avium]MDU2213263.1 hypothetical protein [Enterococcus avium]